MSYLERWQEKHAVIADMLPKSSVCSTIERHVVDSFEPAFLREVEAVIEGNYLIIPTPLMARGYTHSSRLRLRKGRSIVWHLEVLFEGKYHKLYQARGHAVQENTIAALDKCQGGTWVRLAFIDKIYRIGDVSAAYRDAVEYADTLHRRQEAQEANPTMGTTSYDALLDDIASAEARASELELYFYGLGLNNKDGK